MTPYPILPVHALLGRRRPATASGSWPADRRGPQKKKTSTQGDRTPEVKVLRYRTRRCGHRPVVSERPDDAHSCSMAGATPLHRLSLYVRRGPGSENQYF